MNFSSIIGLGNGSCRFVAEMANLGNYDVYYIDTHCSVLKPLLQLQPQSSPEAYEANLDNAAVRNFLANIQPNVLLVVAGGGLISACALRILEELHNLGKLPLNVLYLQPDIETLNGVRKLLDKAAFGILQEYARSGLLERIFVINNGIVANSLGDVPIAQYYQRINIAIASALNLINALDNMEPVFGRSGELAETTRISTIGAVSFASGEEKVFFLLDGIEEKVYYYAINNERLQTDGSLLKKIAEQVRQAGATSYNIFSTDYDDDYCYCLLNTSLVQLRK